MEGGSQSISPPGHLAQIRLVKGLITRAPGSLMTRHRFAPQASTIDFEPRGRSGCGHVIAESTRQASVSPAFFCSPPTCSNTSQSDFSWQRSGRVALRPSYLPSGQALGPGSSLFCGLCRDIRVRRACLAEELTRSGRDRPPHARDRCAYRTLPADPLFVVWRKASALLRDILYCMPVGAADITHVAIAP
jgi:hypothetical protein